MNQRYVVIGGRGYLGSKLFSSIPSDLIKERTSSSPGLGFSCLRLNVKSDFAEFTISKGDTVFLAAAISSPDICERDYNRAWDVNVVGTIHLIESIISRGGRVIFFSSDTVYGEYLHECNENSVCNPAGEYAQMKHEVEKYFFDDPLFKSIRLSYVYSREDKFSLYLADCAKNHKVAEIFHPFLRSVVHRDDVIAGALSLAKRWNEFPECIFNFGGPQIVSRVDFAECIRSDHLHDLKFNITKPPLDFFNNRPPAISMKSPLFQKLLGRSPSTLAEAVRLEFSPISNREELS